MRPVSLASLTGVFLRIGGLTFGGGDPTVAALQSELVRRRGWLPPERYALVFALARITPGTNMLAFTAGAGWVIRGWVGSIAAVLSTTIPAAVLVTLLSAGYDAFRRHPLAMAAIGGTVAAAVGMMAAGAWQLIERPVRSGSRRRAARALAFAGTGFWLLFGVHLAPVVVLGLAAAAGALLPPEEKT